jgi:hypothetical protein
VKRRYSKININALDILFGLSNSVRIAAGRRRRGNSFTRLIYHGTTIAFEGKNRVGSRKKRQKNLVTA